MRITKTKLNIKALEADAMACWNPALGPASIVEGCDAPVARFFGLLTSLRSTESGFNPGEFENAMIGQFRGINLQTGETRDGSTLYLPDLARTHVEGLFASGGGQPIQIDVTIHTQRAKKKDGSLSFTYILVLPDGEVSTTSILDQMEEKARLEIEAANKISARAAPKQLNAPAPKAKPKAK